MLSPFQEYNSIIERHGFNQENDKTTLEELKNLQKVVLNHKDNALYPNSFKILITNIKTCIDGLTRRITENA